MKEERMPKKPLKERRRPFGRPRGMWLDAVDRDAKRMLKSRNWRRSTEDRDAWRWTVEGTKALVGL
jgi:hypothetical protein